MTQHFDNLLELLQSRCLGMAGLVQQAVTLASEAVVKLDLESAKRVFDDEKHIDAEEVEVERQAIVLMTQHNPHAERFRQVFGIVKVNADLERIADCAVNIAQQAPRIVHDLEEIPRDIRLMSEATIKQVEDTVRCLATHDPALAQAICQADDVIDALNSQVMLDLTAQIEQTPTSVGANLALIMVAKNFERIGDHCTNIAEDIVYLMKGEIIRHTHNSP